MTISLTPEFLTMIVAVLISLLFSYVPGFAGWFNGKPPDLKRVIMAGLLLLVTIVIFILACTNILTGVQCTQQGVIELINTFIMALIANQAVDRISPKVGLKKPISKYALAEPPDKLPYDPMTL